MLCVDKTGTITKNQMEVKETWAACGNDDEDMVELMGLACETDTYDPNGKGHAFLLYAKAKYFKRASFRRRR